MLELGVLLEVMLVTVEELIEVLGDGEDARLPCVAE